MENSKCFRIVKEYQGIGKKPNDIRSYYPTGNQTRTITTARNCHPDPRGIEVLVSAFYPHGNRMPEADRSELMNKRLQWNETMRKKLPGFQKRKYKYITITRVEG